MSELIDKTCCFTGHRIIPPEKKENVIQQLNAEITDLINKKYIWFEVGGALGFDTLAAQAVLDLKEKYPQIKLTLVVPYIAQAKSWKETDKSIYDNIKKHADKVIYISDQYHRGCIQKRNRYLVDTSSACICYLDENKGGTFYTVNYAVRKNLRIINIAKNNI